MGSLAAMSRRPMSPARARLIDAAQAARYGLKDLSVLLGRNHSYLQQYVVKGSPRTLPEDVRHRLAELLGVNEAELREGGEAPAARAKAPAAPITLPAAGQRVALIVEGAHAAQPATWPLADMAAGADDQALAIRLTEAHGPLQPRNIILCDRTTPARTGDLAVMLAETRVLAIGLVLPSARGTITLLPADSGAAQAQFRSDEGALWRVLAIRAA